MPAYMPESWLAHASAAAAVPIRKRGDGHQTGEELLQRDWFQLSWFPFSKWRDGVLEAQKTEYEAAALSEVSKWWTVCRAKVHLQSMLTYVFTL